MKRFEDVAEIPNGDKAILREFRGLIRSLLPDAMLYLYGSGARGTRDPDSDLDLLIVTQHRLSPREERDVADAVYELELSRGAVISILFYSRAEWDAPLTRATPFRARVDSEAVLV